MYRDPSIQLPLLFILIIGRIPTDRGRVEQNFRTGKRHQPGRFRIPLIPAKQYPQAPDRSPDRLETKITGGEIKLLIEARIIGNMHLAVDATDLAGAIKDYGSVVIQPGRSPFKQRSDDDQAKFFRQRANAFGTGAGYRFGTIKNLHIFVLTGVRAVM